nr:histone-lysine N-methyltransferase 2D-like isoform X2 [Halyomorpha halys]
MLINLNLKVLQSRRERILKVLTERKPVKPYAMQLLEARAAAKSELSISGKLEESKVNDDTESNNTQGQNITKEPDQKSRILLRIAACRKSKRSVNIPPPPTDCPSLHSAINAVPPTAVSSSLPDAVNPVPSNADISLPSHGISPSTVINTCSPTVNMSPSSSNLPLTPPAFNKATQSDPPLQTSVLSRASQSSHPCSSVDSAIQVGPAVLSSPQQTVRLSEPKIYVVPPTPTPMILSPPPPHRMLFQPPPSTRQSISAAFSRPSRSAIESSRAPPPPSFTDLLENVCKDKLNQSKLSNRKPVSKEEKRRYCDEAPVPFICSPIKSISGQNLLTLDEEQPLEFDSDDSCRKRHTAVVDRLTDTLMANWAKKKTSAELLGADEKELSLLTYGESKRSVVPHFPVRREKDTVNQYTNHGGALKSNDSLPSVRFGKTRHSQLYCESTREKRCMRHRNNKI